MKNLINDVATEARALLNGILADCDTDDISADQFGFEGVIVKNIKEVEGWPRYIPGNQDVVNAGVEELFNHGY